MIRSALCLALTAVLAFPSCADTGISGLTTDGMRLDAPASPAVESLDPAVRAAVGVYAIDLEATKKRAGLFGSMVANAVQGSTLELAADMTYVGRKDGNTELQGSWDLVDGKLGMTQGAAAEPSGHGSFVDDALVVQTRKGRLTVTLVFRRQDSPR